MYIELIGGLELVGKKAPRILDNRAHVNCATFYGKASGQPVIDNTLVCTIGVVFDSRMVFSP